MPSFRVSTRDFDAAQLAVIGFYNTPPAHAVGRRVIVGSSPTDAFTGHANKIAWSDGTNWWFDAPAAGWETWSDADAGHYYYTGTEWISRSAFVNGLSYWTKTGNDIYYNSGNVGVGVAPGVKFDVAGAIRSSNQLISTVASGTAPLVVTSPTLVSNLNADLLDGQHGSYYTGYVQARGMNLVTNGSGLMNSNYNFNTLVFDVIDVHGGLGSFTGRTQFSHISNELIPIDTTRYYQYSAWAKAGNADGSDYSTGNRAYIGFAEYDIDGLLNQAGYAAKIPGAADTELALPLNIGDTTITLVNGTGWYASYSHFVWFPYTNSKGYTYPDYGYSRNHTRVLRAEYNTGTFISVAGNVLTLAAPWPGPALAAGVHLRQASGSTGSYKYTLAAAVMLPNVWTKYAATLKPAPANYVYDSNAWYNGTAYVKTLFLTGYGTLSVQKFSDIWISEISANNLDSFLVPIVSSVATGTPPLVVASTTLVNNLNADLLDGLHSSAFALAGSISGTQNYVAKFNNAGGTTIGNSQIIDNGTNVGIGKSPVDKLDVNGNIRLAAISGANTGIYGYSPTPTLIYSITRQDFVAAGGLAIGSYAGIGFKSYEARPTSFQMYINSTGVGIGTTIPAEKLDVAGNIKVTGALKVYYDSTVYASLVTRPQGQLALDGTASGIGVLRVLGGNYDTAGVAVYRIHSADLSVNNLIGSYGFVPKSEDNSASARITAVASAAHGATSHPTALFFANALDSQMGNVDQYRFGLDRYGNLIVKTSGIDITATLPTAKSGFDIHDSVGFGPTAEVTGNTTLGDAYCYMLTNAATGNANFTLPDRTSVAGRNYMVINGTAAYTITILRQGTDKANGGNPTIVLSSGDVVFIHATSNSQYGYFISGNVKR